MPHFTHAAAPAALWILHSTLIVAPSCLALLLLLLHWRSRDQLRPKVARILIPKHGMQGPLAAFLRHQYHLQSKIIPSTCVSGFVLHLLATEDECCRRRRWWRYQDILGPCPASNQLWSIRWRRPEECKVCLSNASPHMGEKRNACDYQCLVLPQPTLSLLSKPYRLLMCRYVFDYPPSWKVETVGKVIILQGQMVWMAHQCSVYHGMKVIVSDKALAMQNEKGMQGIDCRVRNKIKGRLSWRALQEALRSLDMLWR